MTIKWFEKHLPYCFGLVVFYKISFAEIAAYTLAHAFGVGLIAPSGSEDNCQL